MSKNVAVIRKNKCKAFVHYTKNIYLCDNFNICILANVINFSLLTNCV